jgi:hypothetical protein
LTAESSCFCAQVAAPPIATRTPPARIPAADGLAYLGVEPTGSRPPGRTSTSKARSRRRRAAESRSPCGESRARPRASARSGAEAGRLDRLAARQRDARQRTLCVVSERARCRARWPSWAPALDLARRADGRDRAAVRRAPRAPGGGEDERAGGIAAAAALEGLERHARHRAAAQQL